MRARSLAPPSFVPIIAPLMLLLGVCYPSTAVATPIIGPCSPNTPMTVLQASGGCIAENKLYSNFHYENGGLQISPGVFVTAANILITATPNRVMFATDYGKDGAWEDCLGSPSFCIEEEGSLSYDVSILFGNGRLSGLELVGGDPVRIHLGGDIGEVACLGPGNTAIFPQLNLAFACPDQASSVFINYAPDSHKFPKSAIFSPVSALSVEFNLFIEGGGGITPFGNLISQTDSPTSLWLVLVGFSLLMWFVRRSHRWVG